VRAVAASISVPSRSIDEERPCDIARGSRCVPPHIGNVPSRASAKEKTESGVAILMSHVSTNSSPTETHEPEISATRGTRKVDNEAAGSGETAAGFRS